MTENQDAELNQEAEATTEAGLGEEAAAESEGQQAAAEAETKTPEQERDEFREKYMRALADIENLRKRNQKDRLDSMRYAAERPLGELLPVFDNLQRAVDHAGANPETIVEGVKMILNMATQAFERMGVTPVGAAGQKFDPSIHEAFQQVPSEDVPAGHIAQIFEMGYQLHDRLIRPAKVVVSTGSATQAETSEDPEESAQPDISTLGEGTVMEDASDVLSAAAADLEGWEPGGGSADDDIEVDIEE